MKDLRYCKNYATPMEDGIATMLLYGPIGTEVDEAGNLVGVDSESFANELQFLQDKCKSIDVRINSYGGSVKEGLGIITAILNCKIPVNTYCDGMAYSMAGCILLAGQKRFMNDYASFMLHNPSGGPAEMLQVIKENLITVFKNNSSLSEENISELMNRETFLNAEEALNLGLIDKIISTDKEIAVQYEDHLEMYNVYNSVLIPNTKKSSMKKITNQLDLNENVNEEVIVDSITELQNKVKSLTESLEKESNLKNEIETKLKEFKKAEADKKEVAITEMVNSFVESGVLKTDGEIETAKNFAKIDFTGTKNMLDKIQSKKSVNIMDAVKITNPNVINGEDRSKWTIRDFEMKDSKALLVMEKENPTQYNELKNAFYGNK